MPDYLILERKTSFIKKNRHQFKCNKRKRLFIKKLNFVYKSKGYAKKLATEIVEQVLNSNIRNVAERNGLSDQKVQSMMKAQILYKYLSKIN